VKALPHQEVTTTDVLKLIGVISFLVDHTGFFFDPANLWWRLFGRIAAPIFFFLIGFASTRAVPWTWLAWGLALTALTRALWGVAMLNILLNFALLRFAVLPVVERHVMARPLPTAGLVAACVLLIDVTDEPLEYGTEGWLWAFFGLAHRRSLDAGEQTAWMTIPIAAAAVSAHVAREIHDYGFNLLQSVLLAAMLAGLGLILLRFRRGSLQAQPPWPVAATLRFAGRSSLEIYASTLFAMQLVAYAIRAGGGG
jgi:hypothetical protein